MQKSNNFSIIYYDIFIVGQNKIKLNPANSFHDLKKWHTTFPTLNFWIPKQKYLNKTNKLKELKIDSIMECPFTVTHYSDSKLFNFYP